MANPKLILFPCDEDGDMLGQIRAIECRLISQRRSFLLLKLIRIPASQPGTDAVTMQPYALQSADLQVVFIYRITPRKEMGGS